MRVLNHAYHFIILAVFLTPLSAQSDVVIFYNGEARYGDVIEDATEIRLERNGKIEIYKKNMVQKTIPGLEEPDVGEEAVNEEEDFLHKPSGNIFSITGDIAVRKKLVTPEGKELLVDVEDKFDIAQLRLLPVRYSFFNRQGCYLIGALTNKFDTTWHGVEFRVTLYNPSDRLLASKDFYVFRMPRPSPEGSSRRVFELAIPDVPYEEVSRIRLVRKF
jgi:hypothetical protein